MKMKSFQTGLPSRHLIDEVVIMKIQTIVLLLVIFVAPNCYGQIIDTAYFNKLSNTHALPYRDKNRWLLGCGETLECSHMRVIFYQIRFNRSQKSLLIAGRLIDPSTINDTTGVFSFIFLAQAQQDKLKKIRSLPTSYKRPRNDKHDNTFPYREGDFIIKFEFTDRDRLFFNSPNFRAIEFNIGQLLLKTNYQK